MTETKEKLQKLQEKISDLDYKETEISMLFLENTENWYFFMSRIYNSKYKILKNIKKLQLK